jgi:hypothetical protein
MGTDKLSLIAEPAEVPAPGAYEMGTDKLLASKYERNSLRYKIEKTRMNGGTLAQKNWADKPSSARRSARTSPQE